jgi:uroporphyrinogen-III synthase
MRVAITRALPEALNTAARVQALGHDALLAPLLRFEPMAFDTNVSGAQALLFTSSTGVRAYASGAGARDVPVLAVGDITADAARAAGFADVRSADGDVEKLSALVSASLDPARGKLIHISGAHVAGDLAARLTKAGYTIERRIAYDARAATTLPAPFTEKLDLALFHSPRAADTFVTLGAPNSAQMVAACLSQTVADAAARATWARIIVAPKPREDALLAAALTS